MVDGAADEHRAPEAPLRVALIGAGRMGRAHARVLSQVAFVDIAWVCDANLAAARELADRFSAEATSELDDVLADGTVQAVIITTPTATHAELIERAAGAHKHIFVEKPIASNLPDAMRAAAAVEAAGVRCQVGFQRRYDPSYREAKRAIEAGELGAVEGFRAVSRDAQPPSLAFLKTSGGLMMDLGIHDLDSARHLVGEVDEVYCVGSVQAMPELAERGLFDAAVATLKFENGALGTVEAGLRTAYGYDIRTEVLGEKGRLHIEMDRRFDLTRYDADGGWFERPRDFEQRFHEAYANEIRAFAQSVGAGRPVMPDAADAVRTLRLAIAAQESLDTGRIVRVPSDAHAA